MMCVPCKTAGYALAEGDPEMAEAHHEDCEWPVSCPCGHSTKSVLQVTSEQLRAG